MKILILAVFLLVAAFFANYFGYVSIPWLDINSVSTYGNEIKNTDAAAKKVFED